jgi:hypothetical protein
MADGQGEAAWGINQEQLMQVLGKIHLAYIGENHD